MIVFIGFINLGLFLKIWMEIKSICEEFVVKESMDLKLGEGRYNYFLLEKKNWNTVDVVREVAKRLKIKEREIGFAGNKDRKAWTFQHISIPVSKERVLGLKIKDVSLAFIGSGKERISLGELEGNYFEIVIRDVDGVGEVDRIINYFGEQRFGGNNWKIGKMLVLGKFKEACEELSLKVERNDCLGALKKIGFRNLKFYVHSYQSYLWNELVKGLKKEKKKIPFVGYLYDGNLYDKILKEEGIVAMDFLIRSFKEISAEGGERDMVIDVKNFKVVKIEEKVFKVSFFLPKGAYATEVIRQLIL
jgi:tRNA(Glu) U13 pseudouridine synthase TruD